ncbi:MAG: recombination mediator RecR [Bacteroidales bacterium]|nr:recombination mediator RecR [Bacteroidales bacterium]
MNTHNYPSSLLANAVEQFKTLPGIGERTALRLVLFLLKQNKEQGKLFGDSINELIENVMFCKTCFNISDEETCSICSNSKRNKDIICIVENVKDVMSIENTMQYNGLYHVLGGIISPMDGIGPNDLTIEQLEKRVAEEKPQEVIMAISATMEGETTSFYIHKRLKNYPVKISIIARGVSFGSELEYTDEITLGRSILNRTLFDDK